MVSGCAWSRSGVNRTRFVRGCERSGGQRCSTQARGPGAVDRRRGWKESSDGPNEKPSQTVQIDEDGARNLIAVIDEAFANVK